MNINQYQIQGVLGKGAFATVYKAKNRKTNEIIAIKIITKILQKHQIQLAEKQINILKKINHKNIINLKDHFIIDDIYYLVLEYCGKGDMDQLIKKKKKLDQELGSLIAFQIIKALIDLNNNNIAHRDIKLANIFINDNYQIKLADLGFAKISENEQLLKTYAGTPLTMAPEILLHQKYDIRCDIWSFGVILYYILVGKYPFLPKGKGTIQELIQIVTTKEVQFPNDNSISDAAKDFIKQCLQKKPQKRLKPDQMLSHRWINQRIFENKKVEQQLVPIFIQSQLFYNQLLGQNYMDNERVTNEFQNALGKEYNKFIRKYTNQLDNLKSIIKDVDKIPNIKNSIQELLFKIIEKKLDELPNSKLFVQFKIQNKRVKEFEYTFNQFWKNNLSILQNLKKVSLPKINKQKAIRQQNIQRQLFIELVTLYQKNLQVKQSDYLKTNKFIKQVLQFLKFNMDQFKINFEFQQNLPVNYINLAIEKINDLTKQKIMREFELCLNKFSFTLIKFFKIQQFNQFKIKLELLQCFHLFQEYLKLQQQQIELIYK